MGYNWYGDEWLAKFKAEEKKNITKAAIFAANEVKKPLGIKSPPASEPGQPPHLETGELRRSVAWEVDDSGLEITGRVGTNKIYGRYLALGTAFMKARDLFKGFFSNAEAIEKIARGGK